MTVTEMVGSRGSKEPELGWKQHQSLVFHAHLSVCETHKLLAAAMVARRTTQPGEARVGGDFVATGRVYWRPAVWRWVKIAELGFHENIGSLAMRE